MTTQAPASTPIEVDLVADLACPWCYLGLVRLDRACAMRPEQPVHLQWRPFFLNPQMPPEGMDRATYLRRKFGGDAGRVYARIEEAGRADGIAFAFDRMPRTPNTLLAHRLVLLAAEHGRADAVIRALFRALFEDGRDIGRAEVLAETAAEAGLDPTEVATFLAGDRLAAEVGAAHRQAARIGVQGVPLFIFDRDQAISGAQPAEVLAGMLDVAGSSKAEAVDP